MTEVAARPAGQRSDRADGVSPGPVQSVERALRLIEALAVRHGGSGIADLARATDLPHGTVHRLLQTLTGHGWVRQGPDRRYVLGAALIRLGAAAQEPLAAGATPYLAELVRISGETANLAVLEGDHVAYVAQVPSGHRLRMFAEVGNRVPLHSTAVGKVLLAGRTDAEVDAVLARTGLPVRTAETITEPARLRAELERIRQRGYAVDSGEEEVGVRCLAVPVRTGEGREPSGAVVAAMSVSGPVARFGGMDADALAAQMRAVADRFGATVQARGTVDRRVEERVGSAR